MAKHAVACGDCVWYDDDNSACNRTREIKTTFDFSEICEHFKYYYGEDM